MIEKAVTVMDSITPSPATIEAAKTRVAKGTTIQVMRVRAIEYSR